MVGGGASAINAGAATYDTDGQGRVFVEGAQVCRDVVTYTTRNVMVDEVRRVPYTVTRTVPVEQVRMVPTRVTTYRNETVTKRVPYTVCKQVPCTVKVKVPYTTTEMVPCQVHKKVPVQVCQDVVVKKPRHVPCGPECGPNCHNNCAPQCNNACNECGCGAKVRCCDPHVGKFRIGDREFAPVPLTPKELKAADAVVITTDHSTFDWAAVVKHSRLVLDTRNATARFRGSAKNVVRL